MNWYTNIKFEYKTAQNDIYQQYADLAQQAKSIQIVGAGQNETISIPGTNSTITARDLLEKVKLQLTPILMENGVRVINTDPIPDASAQGLAISHQPGEIHIDLRKIFENAKSALPPTIQFDGTQVDPDILTSVVNKISSWLYNELVGTMAHESQHSHAFGEVAKQQGDFSTVQEYPAEQYQKQIQQRFQSPFARNLPY